MPVGRSMHRPSVYAYKIDYVNYYWWITVEKFIMQGPPFSKAQLRSALATLG
jgi:hypothetical protein